MTWRPKDWKNPYYDDRFVFDGEFADYEAGADAMLEAQKKHGLYGEYGEDFIISSKVKPKDKDWAEDFFATLTDKGWLVFIPDEKDTDK